MKKILIIGNFLSKKRGTYSVCEEIAINLTNNGWDVLTASDKESRLFRILDMIITTWRYSHHYSLAHVDVYSGTAFIWAKVTCWLLEILSKPYILTLHGGNLPIFAAKYPNHVMKLLESATIVTTPSNYLLEQMQPYCSAIQLVPNPIALENYTFKLYQQKTSPRLIWLRAFHNTYNPELAIRVVADLATDYPKIELTMVGPDKGDGSKQRCQRLASHLGIMSRIRFVVSVPKAEVPNWLASGDIFINTTNIDNTPVSIIEAMACGLCIVSTDVGGIPYLLENEKDAILVPPNNAVAMSNAIKRILDNPMLAQKLSSNARKKAENFDWKLILPEWENLYISTIQRYSSTSITIKG